MELPKIATSYRDEAKNITFTVMAYRALTQSELVQSIAYFRSTKAGKKLKPNSTYTIISVIGANDRA